MSEDFSRKFSSNQIKAWFNRELLFIIVLKHGTNHSKSTYICHLSLFMSGWLKQLRICHVTVKWHDINIALNILHPSRWCKTKISTLLTIEPGSLGWKDYTSTFVVMLHLRSQLISWGVGGGLICAAHRYTTEQTQNKHWFYVTPLPKCWWNAV